MKKDTFQYSVLLSKSLPPEVLSFLEGYLFAVGEADQYLFSAKFEVYWPFVELLLLNTDPKNRKQWKVHLPIQYVLAVAEQSEQDMRAKAGFR